MREIKGLKKWVDDYNLLKQRIDDLEVLIGFYKEGEINEDEIIQKNGKKKINIIINNDKLKTINFILFSLIIFFGCH